MDKQENNKSDNIQVDDPETAKKDNMSKISSKGTIGTLATRVSTIKTSLNNLAAMLKDIHGTLDGKSNNDDDKERPPTLDVGNLSTTVVDGEVL